MYLVLRVPLGCRIDSSVWLRDIPIRPGNLKAVSLHTHVFRLSAGALVLLRVGLPLANLAAVKLYLRN